MISTATVVFSYWASLCIVIQHLRRSTIVESSTQKFMQGPASALIDTFQVQLPDLVCSAPNLPALSITPHHHIFGFKSCISYIFSLCCAKDHKRLFSTCSSWGLPNVSQLYHKRRLLPRIERLQALELILRIPQRRTISQLQIEIP